jgi:hypothetical protein
LFHAVRATGAWHSSTLPLDGADGDDALASGGGGLHGAVFASSGLQELDAIAGVWLAQMIAAPCAGGTVDLAVGGDGAVHVVDACNGAIEYHALAPVP